jgi:hypothetical protein
MLAGSEGRDNFPKSAATERVASDASSKTESTASHHIHNKGKGKGDRVEFLHHKANPGPVLPAEISAQQEGTKEERMAKAKEMNK